MSGKPWYRQQIKPWRFVCKARNDGDCIHERCPRYSGKPYKEYLDNYESCADRVVTR